MGLFLYVPKAFGKEVTGTTPVFSSQKPDNYEAFYFNY